jgi:LPXTG-motif cell wall-anchored protein
MTGADSSTAAGLAVALLLGVGLLMRLNRRKVTPLTD